MIKSTGILRKVDGLGRVALPLETRKSLDIGEEDSLELLVDEENGRIMFEKVSKKCLRCGEMCIRDSYSSVPLAAALPPAGGCAPPPDALS